MARDTTAKTLEKGERLDFEGSPDEDNDRISRGAALVLLVALSVVGWLAAAGLALMAI